MTLQNEASIRSLITRYQQRVFALSLYLVGGDKNAAYEITVVSFTRAIQKAFPFAKEENFLVRLLATVIEQSRQTEAIPLEEDSVFSTLPPVKQNTLRVTKKALIALFFDQKVRLLLRDQLHFPYAIIAPVLKISEKNARIQITQARGQFREKVEEVLRRAQ
jgi:DNA-directed RNA polymerase specialized sigma24 family protein